MINASSNSKPRQLIPAGNYVARCWKIIQIGTVTEEIQGIKKSIHKIRIGWELPSETRVFDEAKGPQPMVIDKEFSLSLHDNSKLRKFLSPWRGRDFTADELKGFDISKLIGAPCLLNIIHKVAKSGNPYEDISSATPIPKEMVMPKAVNPPFVLSFDEWNEEKFKSLPDFITEKIKSSKEYQEMTNPTAKELVGDVNLNDVPPEFVSDLPF